MYGLVKRTKKAGPSPRSRVGPEGQRYIAAPSRCAPPSLSPLIPLSSLPDTLLSAIAANSFNRSRLKLLSEGPMTLRLPPASP